MRISGSRTAFRVLLAGVLVFAGCGRFARYPLGKLSVRVIDVSDNKPLQSTAADLYKLTPKGKVYWRASSTDANGIAVFGAKDGGVIEGDYVVRLNLTASWHKLAPGETNDRTVTLRKGDDTVVTFRVVQKLPFIHPPGSKP
jgi:5-hydroxyisourate hydrolase-like protein (transthyretin family)